LHSWQELIFLLTQHLLIPQFMQHKLILSDLHPVHAKYSTGIFVRATISSRSFSDVAMYILHAPQYMPQYAILKSMISVQSLKFKVQCYCGFGCCVQFKVQG